MSKNCSHGVRYGTLCAWCGADLGGQNHGVNLMTQSQSITFSETEASKITSDHLKEIKAKGKLCLLIHMDQVIIDSKILDQNQNYEIPPGIEDQFFITNTVPPRIVRARPYLKEFLDSLSSKYELRIFSVEPDDFVKEVIHNIDPESKLFPLNIQAKNILHGDEAIILDVSSDNWRDPSNLPVCAVVEICPFVPFGGVPRAPMFPLLSTYSKSFFDNRDDNVILSLIDFFKKIYAKFFSERDVTLYDSIYTSYSQILKGCSICTGEIIDPASVAKQDEFRKFFTKYGARHYPQFTPSCTHVIANSKSGPDVQKALEYKGVYIVTFEWLIDSCIHFRRSNEMDFPVTGVVSPTEGEKPIENPLPDKDLSLSEFDQLINGTSGTSESDFEEEEESQISEADPNETFSIANNN